jgi:hypothetical protein
MQHLAKLLIAMFACSDAASTLRSNGGFLKVDTTAAAGRYGSPDCPCIGLDALEGETAVTVKHEKKSVVLDFPADLGAHCETWDVDKHPACPKAAWCKQKWCYVDPCKCKNVAALPKPSDYLKEGKYQGKPVYYSYATCGSSDAYTAEEAKKTEKQIQETCSVKVDPVSWGADSCRCIGFYPQDGTTKVHIDGKLEVFPADTGAVCKKWEEKHHPKCKGDSPPSWCSQAWCYVDPCSCKLATPPKLSSYLPTSSYQGKPVYYSYATCGGSDSYTGDVKDACVNQRSSGDCAKHQKCAWTGKECLGKELVNACSATGSHGNDAVAKNEPDRPIGVGAYQDPKAVKQRTTDSNNDCEHGNWNDCHSPDGDYVHDL